MIIDIARVDEEGHRFVGEESPSILDLVGDETVRVHDPISYDLTAVRMDQELLVRGRIWTKGEFFCTRCGESTSLVVEESAYVESYELAEGGEFLDLTPDIRESILLNFPSYPLCSGSCKGLCPQCGVNRNRRKCRCKEPTENRWSALDGLKLE